MDRNKEYSDPNKEHDKYYIKENSKDMENDG